MNSVLSGLSFNLFVNMKFWMSFRQFFSLEMVVDAAVRLNDGADWVGVKGKKNWTKDGALGDPMLKGNRI